jgi:hypothetical protein
VLDDVAKLVRPGTRRRVSSAPDCPASGSAAQLINRPPLW